MAYWFAGFFARPAIPRPSVLPSRANWRTITRPFNGVGVHLPEWEGKEPAVETIVSTAVELGLSDAENWIYLTYTCWAGRIDSVYGVAKSGSTMLGPIDEVDGTRVEKAYLGLMAEFGISSSDAKDFEPFYRGYWDNG